ncbi:MAG: hypothetical protein ACKVX7_16465 [Planctomycetota bacterium]
MRISLCLCVLLLAGGISQSTLGQSSLVGPSASLAIEQPPTAPTLVDPARIETSRAGLVPTGIDGSPFTAREGVRGMPAVASPFGPPCTIPCPPAALQEGEICGAEDNEGCSGFCGGYIDIVSSDTYCGNLWAVNGVRDLDYYRFTVTDVTQLAFTINSEFPMLAVLLRDEFADCAAASTYVVRTATSDNCVATPTTLFIVPGTYYLLVGAGDADGPIFDGIPCTAATKDYVLSMTLTAAPPTQLCAVTCTPGAVDEMCGLAPDPNGGCNLMPPVFQAYTPGSTLCGTLWADAGMRDLDWYTFSIAATSTLTVSLTSQLPATAIVFGGDCAGLFIIDEIHADPCGTATSSLGMAPGNYILLVLPEDAGPYFEGFPCGFSNAYRLNTSIGPIIPGGCTLPCPGGSLMEPEVCAGVDNNLCLVPAGSPLGGTTPIALGNTFCGTLEADGSRDFDFYEFTLAAAASVNCTLSSQLPASVSIASDAPAGCPNFIINDLDVCLVAGDCMAQTNTSVLLAAGTYYAVVTPGGLLAASAVPPLFSGFPCGSANNYVFTLAASTGLCDPPTGMVTANCATSDLTVDLVAGSCYNSISYVVEDENGASVLTSSTGAATAGQAIMTTLGPIATPGVYTVVITANCCNGDTDEVQATVGLFPYSGQTDIIWNADLEPGCIDSADALRAALVANGRTVLEVTFVDGYDCFGTLDSSNAIWVAGGTFPNNVPISVASGQVLANLMTVQGVAVYMEGADIWGFDPPQPFYDFDGVAGISTDPNVIADGDDSFTSMVGAAVAGEIDTTTYGVVQYGQDNLLPGGPGDDFTDQLLLSGDPVAAVEDSPSGSTASVIWTNNDDGIPAPGEPTYITGLLYVPSDTAFGRVISQSWEFGGFQGSTTNLMSDYLDALVNLTVVVNFIRGNCNNDASFNIADAIFLLNALFVAPAVFGCQDACDANNDGLLNIADAVAMLNALFVVPAVPLAPPYPGCGVDPASPADALTCISTPCP